MEPVDLAAAAATFDEVWSPRIVGRINDYDVKLAKGAGEFPAHVHDDTDELFLVVAGRLRLVLDDGEVAIGPGQLWTVPRGVRHQPIAEPGTQLLLLEPRGTVNTGDAAGVGAGTAGVEL